MPQFLPIPSQKYLKTLFVFDDYGNVKRKISLSNGINKGDIVGSLNKKNGYLKIVIDKKSYALHRILFILYHGDIDITNVFIDHKDGNKLNNKKENLRIATISENCKNCKLAKDNKSGCKGVNWNKKTNKWTVFISINKKSKYLGSFIDFEKACALRKQAEKLYYKEFKR